MLFFTLTQLFSSFIAHFFDFEQTHTSTHTHDVRRSQKYNDVLPSTVLRLQMKVRSCCEVVMEVVPCLCLGLCFSQTSCRTTHFHPTKCTCILVFVFHLTNSALSRYLLVSALVLCLVFRVGIDPTLSCPTSAFSGQLLKHVAQKT